MEYIKDINIQEAVIHILDKGTDRPILNEYALELDEDTYNYLYKHLTRCLKDEELKFAKFFSERGIVKESVQAYLNGNENNIIGLSKEISNQLFAIMKANGNIPSGDVIVASIVTDQGAMIAILKMDYIKNFTHKVDYVNNKIGIEILPQSAGLPRSSKRIKKAAFIKPFIENDEFNLMILDKKKKNEDEYVEKYFTNNFLGCETINSERDYTRALINITERFTRANIIDNAEKAEEIRTIIRNKLKEEESINLEELSQELFKNDSETKENYLKAMNKVGLKKEVVIDKDLIVKKLKRTRLRVDNEIDIYINNDIYNDLSKFQIVKHGDGSIDIVIKNVMNYIEK